MSIRARARTSSRDCCVAPASESPIRQLECADLHFGVTSGNYAAGPGHVYGLRVRRPSGVARLTQERNTTLKRSTVFVGRTFHSIQLNIVPSPRIGKQTMLCRYPGRPILPLQTVMPLNAHVGAWRGSLDAGKPIPERSRCQTTNDTTGLLGLLQWYNGGSVSSCRATHINADYFRNPHSTTS